MVGNVGRCASDTGPVPIGCRSGAGRVPSAGPGRRGGRSISHYTRVAICAETSLSRPMRHSHNSFTMKRKKSYQFSRVFTRLINIPIVRVFARYKHVASINISMRRFLYCMFHKNIL